MSASTAAHSGPPTPDYDLRAISHLLAQYDSGEIPVRWTDQWLQAVDQLIHDLAFDAMETSGAGVLGEYPIGDDGFAMATDVTQFPEKFLGLFAQHGFAVAKNVLGDSGLAAATAGIADLTSRASGGRFSVDQPDTWDTLPVDSDGTPLVQRGFLEIHHDDVLAQMRQSPRMHLVNSLLWRRSDLWVTFDRLIMKRFGAAEASALPLHVDQNPTIDPQFKTLQGVLSLVDSPLGSGTFKAVPNSRSSFAAYERAGAGRGQYIELPPSSWATPFRTAAQAIPMRAGDYVVWDSRTTHANTAVELENHVRLAALIAMGPSGGWSANASAIRSSSYTTGLGTDDRDALCHASFQPRFSDARALAAVRRPERLTRLGSMLYGLEEFPKLGP